MICTVHIQPRKHVLDGTDYTTVVRLPSGNMSLVIQIINISARKDLPGTVDHGVGWEYDLSDLSLCELF